MFNNKRGSNAKIRRDGEHYIIIETDNSINKTVVIMRKKIKKFIERNRTFIRYTEIQRAIYCSEDQSGGFVKSSKTRKAVNERDEEHTSSTIRRRKGREFFHNMFILI